MKPRWQWTTYDRLTRPAKIALTWFIEAMRTWGLWDLARNMWCAISSIAKWIKFIDQVVKIINWWEKVIPESFVECQMACRILGALGTLSMAPRCVVWHFKVHHVGQIGNTCARMWRHVASYHAMDVMWVTTKRYAASPASQLHPKYQWHTSDSARISFYLVAILTDGLATTLLDTRQNETQKTNGVQKSLVRRKRTRIDKLKS